MAMTKVRVLFVMSDLGGGGAERSLLELLGRLDRSRIQPCLFLLKRQGVHLERVPADVECSWGCESGDRLRYRIPSILRHALIQGAPADVIVGAMETGATYVAWLAAAVLLKPLVGWVRTDLHEYLLPQSVWHRWAAKQIYPRCDAVVVPSHGSERSLQRVAALSRASLHILPNPVDPEEVRKMASQPMIPAMRELPARPFVLGVGRLNATQKGFDLLIRAHAEVRRRGFDHNLVILGEGEDRELLQQMARSLGVAESVFLPGFQQNPFPFFRAAAALAAPARLDGFGRVYLEAMALGLPVIGSTASGPMEILDSGKYGIVVPSEDVGALSDAMCALLGDAGAHERYSQLALARANAFCPQAVATQWNELLCTLAIRK